VAATEQECEIVAEHLRQWFRDKLIAFEVLPDDLEGHIVWVVSQSGPLDLKEQLPPGWATRTWADTEGARGHYCVIIKA